MVLRGAKAQANAASFNRDPYYSAGWGALDLLNLVGGRRCFADFSLGGMCPITDLFAPWGPPATQTRSQVGRPLSLGATPD